MADRTADIIHKTSPRAGRESFIIADGVAIGIGALVQLEGGYLNHWSSAKANTFLGIMIGGKDRANDGVITGETSDTPAVEGYVDSSGVPLMHMDIGGSPTQAKVGDLVYCADSDTASMTLTDPTGDNPPVGRVVRYRTADDVDVQLFTPAEYHAGIADNTWIA